MQQDTYYKKLNLPSNPLIDGYDITKLTVNSPGAGQLQPTADLSILNQQTLDAFASVGLIPERIYVLGNKSFKEDQKDTNATVRCAAHVDLHWVGDQWIPHIFAINYELTPGIHNVYWKFWKVDAMPVLPAHTPPRNFDEEYLQGLHFHARQTGSVPNFGNPADYTIIDEVKLDAPILVRTEIPHSVHHDNESVQRYAISIRFSHNFKNWEELTQQLEPLFK